MTRVLLLASYCGDDDPTCTDDLPCLDCLKMCNVVSMRQRVAENFGGWDYNRDLAATGLPRAEAEQKLLDEAIWSINRARRAVKP